MFFTNIQIKSISPRLSTYIKHKDFIKITRIIINGFDKISIGTEVKKIGVVGRSPEI
jgi:hypothetical protein